MAHNKEQHFNPRFYLRNFSENRRSVHLYNIARSHCIFDASIAGQCARPYFYGKDRRVETGLGMLETAAAPLFKRMITDHRLPPRRSSEHGLLAQFVAVQHGRTQAREAEINDMADRFGKHVLRKRVEPELAKYLNHVRISITNAATWNVHVAAVRAPVLFDLEYKLLIAPTGPFYVAGDSPVVFLNSTWIGATRVTFVPLPPLRPSAPEDTHHAACARRRVERSPRLPHQARPHSYLP